MRTFDTGATRDSADGKPDYVGFLSPLVLRRFGQYMLKHQKQTDGQMRPADNWRKGIPIDAYLSSKFRHFVDTWSALDADAVAVYATDLEESLCAELFNTMGLLHEILKEKEQGRNKEPKRKVAKQRKNCFTCKYGCVAFSAECRNCFSAGNFFKWEPQDNA